ncbi:MAG: ATP-binding protein [Bdellovibrionota bacterium]
MERNIDSHFAKLLIIRCLGYLIITGILAFFGSTLIPEGSNGVSLSLIYGVLVGLAIVQFLFLFVGTRERNLFILSFTDICVATFIIKSTGASTSPFQVLIPLLSLVASVQFMNSIYRIASLLLILVLIPLAIGFGATVAGTAVAAIATAIVGFYLRQALEKAGVALSKTEAQKRRLESLQRVIMANIPSGILSVDSRGKIIQVNKFALNILGLEENKVIGTFLSGLFPELDKLRAQLETRTSISDVSEAPTNRRNISYLTHEGHELKLGYSLARLSSPENHEILGTLIMFQDLTEAINMEESLKLSEKLAAVGKLAAGIAHEIRNPLAGISGAAQLLEAATLSEEDQRLLAIIKRESARLDVLITEFLEYVRPAPPKKDPIFLHKIAGHVVESLSVNPKWRGYTSRLHFTAEPSEIAAVGDENRISQVLLNLLLNAGQAGAQDVWVEVMDGTIIRIMDNGPGIPQELQAQIFEPFFTTKDKGTGLGLAIAYKTLQDIGANIALKSPLADLAAGGTLFELRFTKAGSNSKEAA